jgi:PAS domain S-box-containing protein
MKRGDAPDTALNDELLGRAIEEAPDAIFVVDAAGTIQFANPMARTLFGYEADELIGAPVETLLDRGLRDAHVVHRTEYLRHPRARPMGSGLDLHGRRRTGEEFPVEVSLSHVRTGSGAYVIAIVRDVTERRKAAEELSRANEALALVDERERIARDLHDTVIQRLFAVGLSLQGALGASADAKLTARLESAIDEIDATIRDIRAAIFSLHARRVPTSGLRDDVMATCREVARTLGFEPHVSFDGPVDAAATDLVRQELVPTLREALSNVVRHAHATRVSVSLTIAGKEVVLTVEDNGRGIGPGAHGGRGLGNMIERAEVLGGRCDIRDAAAGGTFIEWRVPTRQ